MQIIESADKGDNSAKNKLKNMFDSGLTSEKHNALRRKVYYQKALQGDPNAEYWMGWLAGMIDENASEAMKWYTKSAEHGNSEAMYALAIGYGQYANEHSYGVLDFGRDADKEWYWMKKGAEAGHPKCQRRLASESCIKNDYENGIKWYEKSTESDDLEIKLEGYLDLADIFKGVRTRCIPFTDIPRAKKLLFEIFQYKSAYIQQDGDYETLYNRAVANLAMIYSQEYNKTHSESSLINAVYCFALSMFNEYLDVAEDELRKLPYRPSYEQLSEWKRHAKQLEFVLPAPEKTAI